MQPEERHKRIEQHLQEAEFASLEELSAKVGVSVSTVRRDVMRMEAGGVLKRTHGGARVVAPRSDEFSFAQRDTDNLEAKEAVARACALLIRPNQTLILDAGTTIYRVARQLEGKVSHVITNSLPVANHYAADPNVEVVVSGGVVYPRLGVLVGPLAVETFSKIHADVAIMSGGGVTEEGVTNSHGLLIDLQRAMIAAAQRVIFCFDHTKLGRRSVSHLCGLESIDTIVTDSLAPRELLDSLRAREVEVVVASAG